MEIDNLTIKQARELASMFAKDSVQSSKPNPYKVGKPYFIRTVTMSIVGKLEAVYDNELVLSEASWIASTNRFSNALKDGEEGLDEVEPFLDEVIIGRGSIVDATPWAHTTNLKQK